MGKNFALLLLVALAGLWLLVLSTRFPILTDEAFISFRITQNLLLYGQPYFHQGQDVNISTSFFFPFWNAIWAYLGKENWIDLMPIANAGYLAVCLAVIGIRLRQWFPQSGIWLYFLAMMASSKVLLDEFTALHFQGSVTNLFIPGLSLALLPNPAMSNRFPVFSWWLILVHPAGFSVGLARIFQAWWKKRNFEGIKTSVFWAFWACIVWGVASASIYDSVIPQSWLVNSILGAGKGLDFLKPLANLLFLNHIDVLILIILAIWVSPQAWAMVCGPVTFIFINVLIFGFFAGWPPESIIWIKVPFAWVSGISIFISGEWIMAQLSGRLRRVWILSMIGIWLVFSQIKTGFSTLASLQTKAIESQMNRVANEELGNYFNRHVNPKNIILSSSVGMLGWYAPFHHFLDYPGLTNSGMSDFLVRKKRPVPPMLTDVWLDSAIAAHFEPDIIVVNRQEKAAFENSLFFQEHYFEMESRPFVPGDFQRDSVWIYQAFKRLMVP